MENKLISMVDFVLAIDNVEPKAVNFSSITDIRNYQLQSYGKIVKYANFLKQPLKLGMFVPCIDGVSLNEDGTDGEGYVIDNIMFKEYQQAKDRVLFEGFEVLGQSEGFCEIELKNGDFWMTFVEGEIDVTNQFNQEYSVNVIEDLIQEDLTLTATAIKQLEL